MNQVAMLSFYREPIVADAAVLLDDLGETSEQIADNLQGHGITGHLRHTRACPIANYLHDKLGINVCVNYSEITLANGTAFLPVLAHVSAFLDKFDAGQFPKLIDDRCTGFHNPFIWTEINPSAWEEVDS